MGTLVTGHQGTVGLGPGHRAFFYFILFYERHNTSNDTYQCPGTRAQTCRAKRTPDLLIDNQQHTIIREGNDVPQQQCGTAFGREQDTRKEQICFYENSTGQYWSHILSTRKGIVLKENKSFLYPKWSVRKFLLKVKYLSMKDVSLDEDHNVGMSFFCLLLINKAKAK